MSTTASPKSQHISHSAFNPSNRRSTSRSHVNDPPPAYNDIVAAGVARRGDYETTNLARSPSARRSSSRDRAYESRPHHHRSDSGRSHHRPSSRHASGRNSIDMAAAQTVQTVVANGGSTPVQPSPRPDRMASSTSNATSGRRRTTITAQTGQWALGKTIGQGSMGKVKLAKNMETGEQVRLQHYHPRGSQNFLNTEPVVL